MKKSQLDETIKKMVQKELLKEESSKEGVTEYAKSFTILSQEVQKLMSNEFISEYSELRIEVSELRLILKNIDHLAKEILRIKK